MTKVQARFTLERPPDDAVWDAVARAHSLYGIGRLLVDSSCGAVTVDYDASRLTRAQVESSLRSAGIPLLPAA